MQRPGTDDNEPLRSDIRFDFRRQRASTTLHVRRKGSTLAVYLGTPRREPALREPVRRRSRRWRRNSIGEDRPGTGLSRPRSPAIPALQMAPTQKERRNRIFRLDPAGGVEQHVSSRDAGRPTERPGSASKLKMPQGPPIANFLPGHLGFSVDSCTKLASQFRIFLAGEHICRVRASGRPSRPLTRAKSPERGLFSVPPPSKASIPRLFAVSVVRLTRPSWIRAGRNLASR